MNNIFIKCFIWMIILMSLTNCQSKLQENDYMGFENIEYIDKFPMSFTITREEGVPSGIDVIGITGFAIYDSLMILSTTDGDGFWCIYSLKREENLGHYLKRGNGPDEFLNSPNVGTDSRLVKENDSLFSYILDYTKGILYKLNITETLNKKKQSITKLNSLSSKLLTSFVYIDHDQYLCNTLNDEHTQKTRYLIIDNIIDTVPILRTLNNASIRKGEDFNIIYTNTIFYENGIILEAPPQLNYINLYKLDGSFSKTICIGKEIDCISKIQNMRMQDRLRTFSVPTTYKDFWAVLYIGERMETYVGDRAKYPTILFFDWEGRPLAEIKLNCYAAIFDIDFTNNMLYTFDTNTDEFLKYDITNILEKLNLAKQ